MLKTPKNKGRGKDIKINFTECKQKAQTTKRKKSNEPTKVLENNETKVNLSKKPPVFRKGSIVLNKEAIVKKVKKIKKKLFLKTLIHGQFVSDTEKSTKRIDNTRAQSNLENSLKSKLDLSQKIFSNKNSSPNTVDRIIRKSLKKGKRERILKEKEIKQKKLDEEIKKMENNYTNNLIRKINQQKIKQKKYSSEASTGRARKEKVFKMVSNKLKVSKYRSISSRRPVNEHKIPRSLRSSSVEKEYFACNSKQNDREIEKVYFNNSGSYRASTHFAEDQENEELVEKKCNKFKVKRNISLIDTNELEGFHNVFENLECNEEADLSIEHNIMSFSSDGSDQISDQVILFTQNRAAKVIQKAFINFLENKRAVKENKESAKLQNMIKDQLSWREAQLLSLDFLREKELEDLQSLAGIFGQNTQLEDLLIKVVNQRYEQFTKLFRENLENAEQTIIEEMDTIELLDFSNLIKDRKDVVSKLIEETNLSGTLSKQELHDIIEEGKDGNVNSISCQTEENLQKKEKKLEKNKKMTRLEAVEVLGKIPSEVEKIEHTHKVENELTILTKVDNKIIKKISIEEIMSLSERELLPRYDDQISGLEILDYDEQKEINSPQPFRPSAPLQFLDSGDSSPNTDYFLSLSKPSQSLPLLNLHNLQPTLFQFPATTDRHIETDSDSVKKFISSILIQLDLLSLESELKKGVSKDPLKELLKIRTEDMIDSFPVISALPSVLNIPLIIENILEDPTDTLITTQRLVLQADKIHKIMLLSTADEVLQKFRPYGYKGIPMIWSDKARNFNTSVQIEKIIRAVIEELEDYSKFEIGKIATEEMILSNGHLDEELLNDIREDTLGYAIKREILEFDWLWVDYEYEETQVKLDLSELILAELSQEVVELDL